MPESLKDLDVVALLRDLPEVGLPAGQTGTVVYVHDGGVAFEVEFLLSPRRSVVVTLERDALLKLKGITAPAAGAA